VLLLPEDVLAFVDGRSLFRAWAPLLLSQTSIGFALWIPAFLNLRIDRPWLAGIVRRLSDWSYCLYIIHLSVIAFVWGAAERMHLPMILCTPIALLLCAGLAALSFRYFETPILRRRPKQLSPSHAPATVGGGAAAVPVSPGE
jgi:peptidoglycan/LPS O-acetylase OafA/YrhL